MAGALDSSAHRLALPFTIDAPLPRLASSAADALSTVTALQRGLQPGVGPGVYIRAISSSWAGPISAQHHDCAATPPLGGAAAVPGAVCQRSGQGLHAFCLLTCDSPVRA